MPQAQPMTLDERFAIAEKSQAMKDAGKKTEGVMYMIQHYPMPPYLAEFTKSHLGRDIFHQACDAHRTRLSNSLRTPGINMKEKSVIQQRMANMKTAVGCYIEKQKRALSGAKLETF